MKKVIYTALLMSFLAIGALSVQAAITSDTTSIECEGDKDKDKKKKKKSCCKKDDKTCAPKKEKSVEEKSGEEGAE